MIPLSIIIPTSGRERYCRSTILSVLEFPEEFELVIRDSGDGRGLEEFCAEAKDPRLVYVRSMPGRGMTADFESALAGFRGEYACMIGDDDGITPVLFEAVRHASRHGADSVNSSTFSVLYNWPDFSSRYGGSAAAGRLIVGPFDRKLSFERRSLEKDVAAFLAGAGQGCGPLPRAYHGLVSRRLVDRIRGRFGSCFAGVSPDVSFAFQAALVTEQHLESSWPLTISGTSAVSNAGRSARREHVGDLWTDPHMKHYRDVIWPDVIPEFFSVETVWGQASYEAVQRAGAEFVDRFSLPTLYALCLMRHPGRAELTLRSVERYARERSRAGALGALARSLLTTGAGELLRVGAAVQRRVVRQPGKTVLPAADIQAASELCRRQLPPIPTEAT